MRFFHLAALAAMSVLVSSPVMFGQDLTITNYQLISQQTAPGGQRTLTYRADLVNKGPVLGAVRATLTSLDPFTMRLYPGQDSLTFAPVPPNSQVATNDTFTVLIANGGVLDPAKAQWSFESIPPPPIAKPGANKTATVGSTVTLDGNSSQNPSGLGTLTYNWEFVSRPAGSTAFLGHPFTATPSFVIDVPGNYFVKLTVSNGSATGSAVVRVSTFNTPPVANAGASRSVALGTNVVLDGSKSTSVDGRPLTYSWILTSHPGNSAAVLTGANTVAPSFVADKFGTYIAQLVVDDGLPSDPSTVTITTEIVKPVANAGNNKLVTAGSLVQLDGSGSTDANGLGLTYKWTLISKPDSSMATLADAGAPNPSFIADKPGDYVAQLIVDNGTLKSDPATVTISTQPSLAPTANAGTNQSVAPNTTVTLHGSGADPQNKTLSFQWSLIHKPDGSAASLSSAVIANPMFVADLPGSYVAQLIVSNGTQVSPPVTVMISTACAPPTANAGTDQTVTAGASVNLNGNSSSDVCNDPLTYSWTFTKTPDGSAAKLSGDKTATPTFVADLPGLYIAQLMVNNGLPSTPVTVSITAVASGITVSPNPLTVGSNAPSTITITLPAAAGPNGQVVKLLSSNPSIVTVPDSVPVAPGSNTANAQVTPVSVGTATIFASVNGFRTGTAAVKVIPAAISVALDAPTIGLTRNSNGTVTLSAPAPADIVVTLAASPGGIVNGLPATITIAQGSLSGNFSFTGVAPGTATITASAPTYIGGSATVTVNKLGGIVLPSTLMVGVGQTLAYPVGLASGAPLGGVTVNLTSSDNAKLTVTPSVDIPFKFNFPPLGAQITGVAAGTFTITGSAPGFEGDAKTVIVASASFPATATITASTTQTVTLTLSAPAVAGVSVILSSNNPAVATVPITVSIAAGATTISVPVTGVAPGSATISASSPNFGSASVAVTVVPGS